VAEAGLVMSPRGFGTILGTLIFGRLMNRMDGRIILMAGNIVMLGTFWSMTGWTPDVSVWEIGVTLTIQGGAIAAVFTPLQLLAFDTLPVALRTQGASVFYLVRTVGSAIGISLTSALLDRTAQAEHAVLAGYITPFSRPLQSAGALLNPANAQGAALLNGMIDTQSQIIAYVDDYKFLLLISVPAALSVLLMQKPRNMRVVAAE